ncbi:serine/threonine-protein kinase [Paraliomyxa miuraensis]|uniref:serine/threonine-protein kinase n=1 Tax=Paraliomyxa miuraensis TaxID=376150 RepID=UPI002258234A|nr:serine/threonine-protein kinase [Paraliomyxa miuraensis]MCX4245417.1 protein kinase [Paraliomyxa miuraensis]
MTRSPDAPEPDDRVDWHMERLIASMRDRAASPMLEDPSRSTMPGLPPEGPTTGVLAGDRLGEFLIERRLGSGAMGEVFCAIRDGSGERVALKVLHTTSPTRFYRFKREFRALADITHENLVELRELFVPADGRAFFSMELVEGAQFTDHVRRDVAEGRLPDIGRLEDALVQLVRGVHHLHRARCIHRDLKPSNVLVTARGRVVILDFGLVSEQIGFEGGITRDGQLLGTPAYMAPEQADAETGPAVDYYAIGVMLYECLTGSLPFSGAPMKIILLKQDRDPPDPAAAGFEVPPHLRELCLRLLQRDPALRPTGRELLELLEGRVERSPGGARRSVGDTRVVRRVPFVGRDAELRGLEDALRDVTERGASVTVHVHGRSGHGKSAVVARLLAHARNDERTLVLAGRCYERVWVSYKGVDTVVDALSVHLRRGSSEQRAEARPRHIRPMTRLFPVLADLWEVGHDEDLPAVREPADQRRLGLAALREVLARLGSRRPLVVVIDDLQWGNLDGVNLLTSLMRPPDAPSLLLILAFRDEQADNAVLRALTDPVALEGRDVRALEVGPLPEAAALELAQAFARGPGHDAERLQEVVRGAGGSPFVIAQALADEPPQGPGRRASIERIVVDRLAELAADTRRVLACMAVAGGPVSLTALAEILSIDAVRSAVDDASAMGLVSLRARELGGGETQMLVEISHNRIAEVLLGELPDQERRELHRGLAHVLEQHGADPETLAGHYAQGGAPERAASLTERAAERAAEALAFARAVELYRRALELLPADVAATRRHGIRRALARQLANLGHGSEAATLLLELAGTAEPEDARALRREASNELARSGHIDESIALTTALLHDLGEPAPATRRAALVLLLRERLRLWLRGWSYQARTEAEVPRDRLERLDTLLAATDGTQGLLPSTALHARALSLALDAGEPRRLGKALRHEITILAGKGRHARARTLAIEAQELAAIAADPELDLELDLASVELDWLSYRYERACERLEAMQARLEEVPSAGWMRPRLTVRRVEVRLLRGDLAELRRELPGLVAIARDQGNLQELASLEARAVTVALRYDELAEARRHLAAGRAAWAPARYSQVTSVLDCVEVEVLLQSGEVEQALQRIDALRTELRGAGLEHVRRAMGVVDRLAGRCLVQLALRDPSDRALAARTRALVRRWHRSPDPAARGRALLSEAALLSLEGDVAAARRSWRRAQALFERHGMRGHLAATRLRLAALTTEHEYGRLAGQADAYLTEQGIEARERFVDVLAPSATLQR